MSEQVCKADMGSDGAAVVDTYGYPVETTGNAVLDILEHRSSTPVTLARRCVMTMTVPWR